MQCGNMLKLCKNSHFSTIHLDFGPPNLIKQWDGDPRDTQPLGGLTLICNDWYGVTWGPVTRHVDTVSDTIDLAFLAAFGQLAQSVGLQDMANKGNTHRVNRRRKLCTAAIKRVVLQDYPLHLVMGLPNRHVVSAQFAVILS